jgi:hypothetical protein
MIHIDRQTAEPPAALAADNSPAAEERKKADAFFVKKVRAASRKAPRKKSSRKKESFSFSVYSDETVKRALNTLFGGKCAYCESKYAATQPMDVEHYRPKGRVHGTEDHPGYYWLASEWHNLLPSCIDCNRMRNYWVPSLTASAEETRMKKLVYGKGDRFPLLDETQRAHSKGMEHKEAPLLLHPCLDIPENYLVFTDEAVVRPKDGLAPEDLLRAEESINVYGLNRSGLVQTRLEVLRLLQGRRYCIRTLIRAMDHADEMLAELIEDLLSHEIAEMSKLAEPRYAYSLMCRQFIERFKLEFDP